MFESLFNGHNGLSNIILAEADGAPAIFEHYRQFISHSKQDENEMFIIHYVTHQQHFVDRTLSDALHHRIEFVINAVNKIRSNTFNTKLFTQL